MQYQTIINWSQDNTVNKVLVALAHTAPEWKSPRRVTYKAEDSDVLYGAKNGSDVLSLLEMTIHNRQVISEFVEKDYERSLKRFIEFLRGAAARNSLDSNQSDLNAVHLLTGGAARRIQKNSIMTALDKQPPNLRELAQRGRIGLADIAPNPYFLGVQRPEAKGHTKTIVLTSDEATKLTQHLIAARQKDALDDLIRAKRVGQRLFSSIPEEAQRGYREASGEKNDAQRLLTTLARGWEKDAERGLHMDAQKSLLLAIEFQYTVIGRVWQLLRRSTGFFSTKAN